MASKSSPKVTRSVAGRSKDNSRDSPADRPAAAGRSDKNSEMRRVQSDPGSSLGLSSDVLQAITASVSACLNDDVFLDRMMTRLTDRVSEIVNSALVTSLESAKKEIGELKAEVNSLKTELCSLKKTFTRETDSLNQYYRRNNLRIFGLPESSDEDTDRLVLDLVNNKLGIDLDATCIDRSHRVGRVPVRSAESDRPRPLLVRFISYRYRRLVMDKKSMLRGTNIVVREDLTPLRAAAFREAAHTHGIRNTWTRDGKVFCRTEDGGRISVNINI
jgi:hypothetical protein